MATLAGIILCLGAFIVLLMMVGFVLSVLTGRFFKRIWLFAWGEDAKDKPSSKDAS